MSIRSKGLGLIILSIILSGIISIFSPDLRHFFQILGRSFLIAIKTEASNMSLILSITISSLFAYLLYRRLKKQFSIPFYSTNGSIPLAKSQKPKIKYINVNDKVKYKFTYTDEDIKSEPEKINKKASAPICIKCKLEMAMSSEILGHGEEQEWTCKACDNGFWASTEEEYSAIACKKFLETIK